MPSIMAWRDLSFYMLPGGLKSRDDRSAGRCWDQMDSIYHVLESTRGTAVRTKLSFLGHQKDRIGHAYFFRLIATPLKYIPTPHVRAVRPRQCEVRSRSAMSNKSLPFSMQLIYSPACKLNYFPALHSIE